MSDLKSVIRDLVAGNRIMAHENIVDAYGHISVRHPDNPNRYLLSRARSPELVEEADIMEFELDGTPVDRQNRPIYIERPIHGGIYKARPDINGVCHNHAHSLIPYGVTETVMKPILHVASVIGAEVPIWEIREEFGNTNLLVTDNDRGRSLARALGGGRAILMRGHGATVAAQPIRSTGGRRTRSPPAAATETRPQRWPLGRREHRHRIRW